MIYYQIGRARVVMETPLGCYFWRGGTGGIMAPHRRSSLFHIMVLSITSMVMSQTLGVKDITPVSMSETQAAAISARIKTEALKHAQTVDRGTGFNQILLEHGLRQAGVTSSSSDSLALTTADQILSGTAGQSATDRWFIDLSLTDVATGRIINSKSATVSSYTDLLTISKSVTRALLMGTDLDQDPAVVKAYPDSSPIIIGTNKVIVETHVYEHKTGTHGNKRFIPCNFCQGRGKVPCRECPRGEKDCPFCSVTSFYKGPETHWQFMTGHWEE